MVKQPEWQRGGICGALSSKSQQLNIEPSEQREREKLIAFNWRDTDSGYTDGLTDR